MRGQTAQEVAASLPPLTETQVNQIATLLGIVQTLDGEDQ